jgi:hypothetical protein
MSCSTIAALLLLVISCRASLPKANDVRDFHWRDRVPSTSIVPGDEEVIVKHAPSTGVSILFRGRLGADLQPAAATLFAAATAALTLPLEL